MQQPLARCPNLRVVNDTIPERLLFVYEYLASDLLHLAVKDALSDAARRRILRDALTGLAYLHRNKIFHTGKEVATPT
jgi:serine/threonine protein kinase